MAGFPRQPAAGGLWGGSPYDHTLQQSRPSCHHLASNSILMQLSSSCLWCFWASLSRRAAVSCAYVSILRHKHNIKESTHKDDITPISWPWQFNQLQLVKPCQDSGQLFFCFVFSCMSLCHIWPALLSYHGVKRQENVLSKFSLITLQHVHVIPVCNLFFLLFKVLQTTCVFDLSWFNSIFISICHF